MLKDGDSARAVHEHIMWWPSRFNEENSVVLRFTWRRMLCNQQYLYSGNRHSESFPCPQRQSFQGISVRRTTINIQNMSLTVN